MNTYQVTWDELKKDRKTGKQWAKKDYAHFKDEQSAKRFAEDLYRTATTTNVAIKPSSL